MRRQVALILVTIACALHASAAFADVLGKGRGLDHLGIAVQDLARARADYAALGFQVLDGGHFPDGSSNALIYLDDLFYLELITAPAGAKGDAAWISDFAAAHEGGIYIGINVSSAKDAAAFLKAHKFDVVGPEPGSMMREHDTKPPQPQWYSVYTADKPAAGKRVINLPIFFIEYVRAGYRERLRAGGRTSQRNGIIGMRAIWIATRDLDAELAALPDEGLASATREVSFEGLTGREAHVGSGTLNLVASPGKPGEDDDRIIGLTLFVQDLAKARAMAEAAAKTTVPVHRGAYGPSVLLPLSLTHGLHIELIAR